MAVGKKKKKFEKQLSLIFPLEAVTQRQNQKSGPDSLLFGAVSSDGQDLSTHAHDQSWLH